MMILCLFGFFSGVRMHQNVDMITDPKDTAEINHYQSRTITNNHEQSRTIKNNQEET
jgi:hypothetical protein